MSRHPSGNVCQVPTIDGGVTRRVKNRKGAGGLLRDDLVAAAGRLLDEGGEPALTIRAVAREVNAAPQSVYLHFANREQLLWAVLTLRFQALRAELDAAESEASDPVERLLRRCSAYCTFALAHPRRYRLLLDRRAPELVDRPAEEFPGYAVLGGFIDAVRACLEAASPPDPAPTAPAVFVIATDLLSTLHGAVLLRTGMPSFPWPPIADLVERTVDELRA